MALARSSRLASGSSPGSRRDRSAGRRAARRAAIVLGLLLAGGQGCAGFGHASWDAFDGAGAAFARNPVSIVPYWTGFVLFAVVGLPIDLVTWPATALFYPDTKPDLSREFYWFSALGPSVFLGVGGGSVLGGILYPFGIPFMGDANDWNEVRPPSDDEPLPPPPGGSAPPPGVAPVSSSGVAPVSSSGVAPVSSGGVAPIGSR